MSFSGNVKEELSKINNLAHKQQVIAELYGYMDTINTTSDKSEIKFSTESQYNINRYSKFLKSIQIDYDIDIQGKVFSITFKQNKFIKEKIEISTEIEKKAYIRGIFLGSGSLNDPNNTYHLEIILKDKDTAKKVINILEEFRINSKPLYRKKGYSIYIKEGEEISKLLFNPTTEGFILSYFFSISSGEITNETLNFDSGTIWSKELILSSSVSTEKLVLAPFTLTFFV